MSRFGMRGWVVVLATSVMAGMLSAAPAVVAEPNSGTSLSALKQPAAVPVRKAGIGGTKRADAAASNRWKTPKVTWPGAGSATVDLTGPAAKGAVREAGSLPVSVAATSTGKAAKLTKLTKVKVAVADRTATDAAGVDGLLLSVSRADGAAGTGKARVAVDYSSFRGAYGGDWASRLRLAELPACVLTTPQKAACRTSKPLATDNETTSGRLTATVDVSGAGATVLAAAAEAAGPSGDYKATSLQPSGTWSAGGSTGAFNWSYPIGVPAVPGGLQPSVGLGYNSQTVDGRTAASNNQPSWIGDGWSYEPGYIERRYKACNDDKTDATNTTKVGDLCWYNDNAVLNLGGKSTELVHDSEKGWHPAQDAGEKVEKLTGADNADKGTAGSKGEGGSGEHWKITTTDGTQYFFGLNKLPGWSDNGTAADDPLTNSVLTAPVFGNQTGEPCYDSSFASAWCQQAWRWQLDYVVDVHGNAMTYHWKTEKNNYGRNVSETTGDSTATDYVRGAYLDHIDYGLRAGSLFSAKAAGQVHFGVEERCLVDCGTFDEANAKNWPDVPFDQYCKDGAECKDKYSPTFWSKKRLTTITTKVLTAGAYKDVDSWSLKQGFPAAGDGISTPMWLESITRTGKAGGSSALPPVTFAGQQKPNRVDKLGDGLAPFIRLRLYQITTESGGTIAVDYRDPDCTATSLPPTDDSNSTRCYPVKWAFEGETAKQDWFNSYVVERVYEGDNLAETPDTVTEYDYLGGADWAKSTDEFTKAADRTYSLSRGYGRVETRKGAGADTRFLSETRYFRGIDGAEVKNSAGDAVTDREQFAGVQRESATYNGDGGSLVSAVSYTPWRSAKTATRARTGLPDLEAYLTGTEAEETRTTGAGGTRTVRTTREFDSYGMVTSVSALGDTAKSGDEQCTTTTYARNTTSRLLDKVSRSETVAAACGAAVSRPDDVIDDVRTYYDGLALGAAPTDGDVTKTERINGKGDGYDTVTSTPSTCGAAKDELCFDQYGRQLAEADAYGKVTSTVHTPATGEVPTTVAVTNALGHTVTTTLDPLRAQALTVTDANDRVTTSVYDPLGRVTKTWLPNRAAATNPDSPNYSFAYLIRRDNVNVVTTTKLTHDAKYATSYAFYDGLLRPRQTQEESPDRSGRLITESFHDTRGLADRSSGTYYATGPAEPVLVTGQETKYPAHTETLFDGAGRPTDVISKKFTDETKRTTTSYTGDTTTVVPPKGATATTTVVDALGRTTELKQYTDAERTTSQTTAYAHDKKGRLAEVTDPSGAKWTYGYDIRGRQTTNTDPDKGSSTTTYDKGDRATDTLDARGITLHTDYDDLGRQTALKKGTTTLATWSYDTASRGKGQVAKTTRHVGANAYETAVTSYDAFYQPILTQMTIPANEGALAGTYKWTTGYNPISGQVARTEQPAMGGLPAERVANTYTPVHGQLDTVGAGADALVSDVTYDHYGRAIIQKMGAFAQSISVASEYDEHTSELTRSYIDREVAPQRVEDTSYTYDPAGNIKQIATAYGQDVTRTTDTQCFALDQLRRITEAWTNTGTTCAAAPSSSVVGGPDAYWTTYAYDAVGNRKTETEHTTDTVRTYAAPDAGKHNLPSVTQTGTVPRTETYTYDAAGNTETRKIGNADKQTFVWDDEGHLGSVTKVTDTTSYVYDTAGERMIRRDATGTTLYLPGGNELHLDKAGKVTGTRYYAAGEQTVAMRTGGKLTFLLSDHHGTATTQITADPTQAITRRKTTIFGAPRGTQPPTWAGDKGFVGGTIDKTTDLTHLGAREYDPPIGRFISVDPILDLADPQQTHGYTYGNNNPVSFSDATGLRPDGPAGGADYNDHRYETERGTEYTYNDEGGGYAGGWFVDSAGGWSYRHEGYVGNSHKALATTTIWSWRAKAQGYSYKQGWSNKFYNRKKPQNFYTKFVAPALTSLLLPDVESWGECFGSGSVSGCAEASTDVAFLKVFKLLKAAKGGVKGGKKVDGDAPSSCARPHSFLPGTKVLLADGSTKNIEDVEEGDRVVASDPDTGETKPKEVIETILTEDDKAFTELTVDANGKQATIVATDTHPFWSLDEKKWINAGDIRPGMELRTPAKAGVEVDEVRHYKKRQRTHDLTVNDIHTYYVVAGQMPVLVHNSNCAGVGRDLIGGQEQFHIIHGDRTGGGHKWPGQPGKTVFPRAWDTDKILDGIADVATSPNSVRTQQTGRAGALYTRNGDPSRWKVEGVVDGVNIRVIYEPATGRIVTGFPYRP
ncbi:polymorphic toxin-type HINT domain-containing protein [Streptomyces sp. NPDC050428]|uniref:polymorphic toxin-type HINT domain-containing protein n=1 Tax=Streptomyces sp. NPDC050428 TaxID=3155757 RepID=UPI003433AFD2